LPIRIEPARAASVFAAIENVTLPGPLPVAPDTIVNHGTLLVAVHVHPTAVVTAIGVPVPAVAPADCVVGVMESAQLPA
jgi:hypothetical protein